MAAIAYVLLLFLVTVPPCFSAYDYMMFALQWPRTVCIFNGPCTITPPNKFTIHGMWPNNITGPQPAFCDSQAFDQILIPHSLPGMYSEWPDVYGNDIRFWDDEWRKHGTCALGYYDQLGYFTTALDIKQEINIENILAQNNIYPGTTFPLAALQRVIRNALQGDPEIVCNGPGFGYLKEIRICLDQPADLFIPCPNAARTRCNSLIYLP